MAQHYSHYNLSIVEENAHPDAFYVVWFCKVLGNWKAMVSTDLEDGLYWEVTFNGNKEEAYVDEYRKSSNKAYTVQS